MSVLTVCIPFAAVLFVGFELPMAVAEKIFFEWLFEFIGKTQRRGKAGRQEGE